MTDQFDRAQQLEEMQREIALKKHRTFKAVSRLYCEDCDAPIPEKRRQMIQGVTSCVVSKKEGNNVQIHYAKEPVWDESTRVKVYLENWDSPIFEGIPSNGYSRRSSGKIDRTYCQSFSAGT